MFLEFDVFRVKYTKVWVMFVFGWFEGVFGFGCVFSFKENYPPLQAMFFHFAIQSTLFLLVYNCITALYNGITARRGLF